MAKIYPIKLFKDNYSYLIQDIKRLDKGILVDPADSEVINNFLTDFFPKIQISHILFTHKHWDHIGKP